MDAVKYEKQKDDVSATKNEQGDLEDQRNGSKGSLRQEVESDERDEPWIPRKNEEVRNQSWLQLIAPDGCWIFLAAFLSLVSASADLFYPYMIGLVYRHLMEAISMASSGNKWSFEEVLQPIVILFCCQWLATTTNKAIVGLVKRRLSTRVRKQLFANMISQDLEFFDRGKVGEMVSRLMKDVGMLESFLLDSPLQIISAAFKLIGCCVITVILSWKLAMVNMLLIPIFGVLAIVFGQQSKKVGKHYTSTVASVSQAATELLASVRTIQAFGREKDAEIKFNKKVNEEHNVRESTGNVQIAWRCSEDVFVKVLQVVSLWYGAILVVQGQLDIEYIIVFQMYARLLQGAISALFMNGSRVFQLFEMLRPLHKLLFAVPKLFKEGITPGTSFDKGLTVKHLDFAYPTMKSNVLDDINFVVPCGSTVGIVGRSGSGKSTLLQLLLRFYDPQMGAIRLDGHDLRSLDLKWLRERFGYVSQEPVVLNASVAENIAFGAREMDFRSRELWDLVLWAARAAQAHGFIRELPQGYKTQLGANGAHLSGGQKQRIAIARALIRRPDILILDEATSCLDPVTERQLMTGLVQMQSDEAANWKPKVVFIIAHRLSLVRSADMILVVDRGRIVQQGTHTQLVEQVGLYAQLLATGDKGLSDTGRDDTASGVQFSIVRKGGEVEEGGAGVPNGGGVAPLRQASPSGGQQIQQQQVAVRLSQSQPGPGPQGQGQGPVQGAQNNPAKGAEGLKYILQWV